MSIGQERGETSKSIRWEYNFRLEISFVEIQYNIWSNLDKDKTDMLPILHIYSDDIGVNESLNTMEEEHAIQTNLFVYIRFHSRNTYSK